MLYFAYGSNMNHEQMKDRCPDAKYVDKGYLKEYKLAFDGHSNSYNGLVATIVKDENGIVPFVLWDISDRDKPKLDLFEGYRENRDKRLNMYDVHNIEVPGHGRALVYIMSEYHKPKRQGNRLPPDYIDKIRQGYTYFSLNQKYLDIAMKEVGK